MILYDICKKTLILTLSIVFLLSKPANAADCSMKVQSSDNIGISYCIGVIKKLYEVNKQDAGNFGTDVFFDMAGSLDKRCDNYMNNGSVRDMVSNGTLLVNMALMSVGTSSQKSAGRELTRKKELCFDLFRHHFPG